MIPRSAEKGVRVTRLAVVKSVAICMFPARRGVGKLRSTPPSHEDSPPLRAADVAGKPGRLRASRPHALRCLAWRRRRPGPGPARDADLRTARRRPLDEPHGGLAQADRPPA